MKVLKRRFNMTKEEVVKNIRLVPYHRLYLKYAKEIESIRKNPGLTPMEKLQKITNIKNILTYEWDRING